MRAPTTRKNRAAGEQEGQRTEAEGGEEETGQGGEGGGKKKRKKKKGLVGSCSQADCL